MSNLPTLRAGRIRRKLKAVNRDHRPRLSIHKSNRFVTLQLIDDVKGVTLAAASEKKVTGADRAERLANLGTAMGESIKKAGVTKVVFDRSFYRYTGVVAKVADAVRKAGIEF